MNGGSRAHARAAAFLVACAWLAGCADRSADRKSAPGAGAAGTSAPLRRVVFIGIDGADWRIIQPLVAAGRLPNLARIVRDGATGPLQSLEPMLSPLLWTTMATGKLPEQHGILSFTAYDKDGAKVPIGRNHRKVDAFWNMLSDAQRRVDIVGWLATHPAETINGVMVTDRMGYLAYAGLGDVDATRPGNMTPQSRAAEIGAQLAKASSVPHRDIAEFVDVDEATFLRDRTRAFDTKDPVNNLIMLYASTLSYRNIAKHLLEADQPDFLGVYFELLDATGHLFMQYAPPLRPGIDRAKYDRFHRAVDAAYELQDEILGDLMAVAGDRTVIMLCSDHGFHSGESRPSFSPEIWAGQAPLWHRMDGVVCLFGSGVRKGHRIEGASLVDVAPTILALQGLPQPADMPGKALAAALDDSLAARIDKTVVATLQRERETAAVDPDDPTAREALKKLEALGYIAPQSPDQHNNLGQRYQQQGQYEKAIEEFEQALLLKPRFPGALNNLGVCYQKLGRHPEAEKVFRQALEIKPNDIYALNNLAISRMELGDLPGARTYAQRAVQIEPNYANGHVTLGSILGTMGDLQAAERSFRKVLEIDPNNQHAKTNIEKIASARGGR